MKQPWILRRVSERDRQEWIEAVFLLRTADSPLVILRAMSKLRDILVQYERAAVEEARAQGATWGDIGEALARSRQSVHRQYAASGDSDENG
jgi:hypothetical protein